MIFNSFSFIGFFVIIWCIIALTILFSKNVTGRNTLLLTASYILYGSFNISFIAILIYVTLVNYIAGVLLQRKKNIGKVILGITILLSLSPLFIYKYLTFILSDILEIPDVLQTEWISNLILPVGISFFTFQALTYTIDLYRDKVSYCKNPIDFALFVSFFPTILSGPIEKARNLLPQIKSLHPIKWNDVTTGCSLFVWGLFKKIVIADRLATYVDWAYTDIDYVKGGTLALAALFYSIQIYCDFSGYSDMAVGVARCLGFQITQNFRFPYFSTSIKDFWKKWHISLTSWFTEYVYFSLGGNRVKLKTRWVFNITMVFILSGIWHGAAWNFFLWGFIHAFLYLAEHFMGLQRKNFKINYWYLKIFSGFAIFILVTISWVFFRIEDASTAFAILSKICSASACFASPGASAFTFATNIALLSVFIYIEWRLYHNNKLGDCTISKHSHYQIAWQLSLLLMLAFFGVTSDKFVYFQF